MNLVRKSIVVLVFLGVLSNAVFGQKVPQDDVHGGKHYGIDDPVLWLKTKQALHLESLHSYYNAIDLLVEVFKEIPDNHFVSYKLGELYYQVRDPKSAVDYYKYISDPKNTEYPIALFHYGECLKQLAMYPEAREQFYAMSRYRDKTRDPEIKKHQKWAKQEIRSCDFAVNEIDRDTAFVNVDLLGGDVNMSYTDFAPVKVGDTLLFASLRQDSVVSYKYGEEKFFPVKMYQTTYENDNWTSPIEFWNVNHAESHTANGAYTPNKEAFYFTRCHNDQHNKVICAIYVKKLEKGKWGKAHKLHSKVNLHAHTSTQPTFGEIVKKRRRKTTTESVLYFVSDRPGGIGGKDIWYSVINEKGKPGRPMNCGKKINTERDEISPYYDNENYHLYFSSNYHYGIGGFDVHSSKGHTKRWAKPQNVGIPWNSSYDDTYYVPVENDKDKLATGFLVSNRPGGKALKSETCCDDIYSYEEYLPEEKEITGKVFELLVGLDPLKLPSKNPASKSNDSTGLTNEIASSDSNFVRVHTIAEQRITDSLSKENDRLNAAGEQELTKEGLAGVRVGFVRQRHLEKSIVDGKLDKYELESHIEWVDTTKDDGAFTARLYKERQYALVVEKDGYNQEVFPIDWERMGDELKAEIVVTKEIKDTVKKKVDEVDPEKQRQSLAEVIHKEEFEKNEKFVLENMYFESNHDHIKKSSEPSLQLLLKFLEARPDVKIEVSGHTDSRGDAEYNMDLSQRRAESVKEYLEDAGVSPRRIIAKGYGETSPIADNENEDGSDNPEGRRKNRRTEVIILSSGKR